MREDNRRAENKRKKKKRKEKEKKMKKLAPNSIVPLPTTGCVIYIFVTVLSGLVDVTLYLFVRD